MDIVDRLLKMSGPNKPNVCSEAATEIERLRSLPCPYVVGDVTRHCTLTPFTLTPDEREAVEWAVSAAEDCQHPADDTLRGLLERLK